MQNVTPQKYETWQEAYNAKVALGWSLIDRKFFREQFMLCQYQDVNSVFNPHGEPYKPDALGNYFNKIRRGLCTATDEARIYAEQYFQINRNELL